MAGWGLRGCGDEGVRSDLAIVGWGSMTAGLGRHGALNREWLSALTCTGHADGQNQYVVLIHTSIIQFMHIFNSCVD